MHLKVFNLDVLILYSLYICMYLCNGLYNGLYDHMHVCMYLCNGLYKGDQQNVFICTIVCTVLLQRAFLCIWAQVRTGSLASGSHRTWLKMPALLTTLRKRLRSKTTVTEVQVQTDVTNPLVVELLAADGLAALLGDARRHCVHYGMSPRSGAAKPANEKAVLGAFMPVLPRGLS